MHRSGWEIYKEEDEGPFHPSSSFNQVGDLYIDRQWGSKNDVHTNWMHTEIRQQRWGKTLGRAPD